MPAQNGQEQMKCFCSVYGQKPNQLSLSYNDDTFSVPAATSECYTAAVKVKWF